MKEIIQIKRASFSNQTVNSTVKSIGRQKTVSKKKKNSLTSIQLQTIQNVAEGKTKFSNPYNPRQDKIKRRVQNFKKIGKIVAAATIGDYLVNPNLWTISSLSNRLFDSKTNMLNSSICLDFPNGKYMYL